MQLLDAKVRRNLAKLLHYHAAEYPDPERVMAIVEELERGAQTITDWPPGNVWVSKIDSDAPELHNFRRVRDQEAAAVWAKTQCGEYIHWVGFERGVRMQRRHAAAFAQPCTTCHEL